MKFRSLQEIDHVRKKMDPMLVEGFEKSGFMTFGLAEGGFAYLMSNNPIRTTDDLRSHKVWIPGNDLITAAVLKKVGINPIPLPTADVLTSLQTGPVDTVPAPPIAAMKVLQKNGIQFVRPTPEAQAEWRAAGIEVTQKLLETGRISLQALEQLDSLLEATGS